MEKIKIADREFSSRLFLGTGKFNNNQQMAEAIKASETEMVTVAMKRVELSDKNDDLLTHVIQNKNIQLLPNTSGVRDAKEAVFAAMMAREAFGTNWVYRQGSYPLKFFSNQSTCVQRCIRVLSPRALQAQYQISFLFPP